MIKLLEISDSLKRGRSERALSLEDMEDDAFEEVAEREVMVLGKRLEHFQDALFHSDARLDALNLQLMFPNRCAFHVYPCTRVHVYRQ